MPVKEERDDEEEINEVEDQRNPKFQTMSDFFDWKKQEIESEVSEASEENEIFRANCTR